MPKVRYVANRSYTDGTSRAFVGPKRLLVLGGPSVELTDAEIARLSSRVVLEEEDEEKKDTPAAPENQAVPAAPAPQQTGVSTGSAPETNQSLPTPDKGN